MSESIVINLPSAKLGGFGPNYPSSIVMVFGGRRHRRKQSIKNIFEIVK